MFKIEKQIQEWGWYMSDYSPQVNKQYGRDNLADQIIIALKHDGKDIDKLTRADLLIRT